jgi:formamidopyrimidine-DNA glycosylase
MPELPEAQTIASALDKAIGGKTVQGIRLLRRDFLKTGAPRDLTALAGQRIQRVFRRGKSVVIVFAARRVVLQLGMSGRVYVAAGAATAEPLPPHTHIVIACTDGAEARYANARRIASGVHVLAADELGPLARMGPDANTIGRAEFIARIRARRTPIKAALLNQSILAGVGNIYADESLFRAGIRPTRAVTAVSDADLARLHGIIGRVLAEAIAAGGSTIKGSGKYADPHGEVGGFTTAHRAYGRYGQPCQKCHAKLRRTEIGGRTTTYCPHCQK